MPDDSLTLANVRFFADRVEELQDGRPVQTIAAADIHHVSLRFGILVRHPILQLVVASLTTVASAVLTLSGVFFAILSLGLGVYFLFDALRRGHYLEVFRHRGKAKLAFGRRLSAEEIAKLHATLPSVTAIPLDH